MNIILIISDTFRQDHLGCYGNKHIHTPHLDQFAETGSQFENCYITSFPTMPMRADLFTGKYAFSRLGWAPLPPKETTLSEYLYEAGYVTLAAVDTPFLVRNAYGYDRGFKDFSLIPGQGSHHMKNMERARITYERRYEEDYCAPKTTTAAIKCIEYYHKEKFFLYIDMWDPHEPWNPPAWYVEKYYPGYDGRSIKPCYCKWREKGLLEEEIEIAHACYCGEITMVDRCVGRIVDRVRTIGLWENTAIIFTSDHGFYFGEHGIFGKALQEKENWVQAGLYREVTRVPLLIYIPGIKPKSMKALVSSIDIMPTVLELAGIEIPDTIQGKSMVPLIEGEIDSFRDFAVSSYPLYNPGEPSKIVDDWIRTVKDPHFSTVSTSKWSFLYSTQEHPAQLYNTETDPKESHNVIDKHWSVATDLHQKFVKLLEEINTSENYLSIRRGLYKH